MSGFCVVKLQDLIGLAQFEGMILCPEAIIQLRNKIIEMK